MADKEEVVIELKVNGFTQLKADLKAAKGELANFEFGTKGFADAQKKIQELQDSLGDLNDATKINGNGVEKLGASFGLLKESLGAGDFDKAKLALSGIGKAMDAIPIFLLIEGVKLLIDNFQAVVAFFDSFTDSAKNIAALAKEQERLNKSFEQQKAVLDAQISVMQAKLDLDKELGMSNKDILKSEEEIFLARVESVRIEALTLKSKLELHKAKIEEIRDNDSVYESIKRAGIAALELLPQTKATTAAINKLQEEIDINKKERAAEDIKSYEEANKRAIALSAEAKTLIINHEKDIVVNKHEQTEKWKKSEEEKTKKLEEEEAKRRQIAIDRANEDLVIIPEIKQQQALSEQEIKDRQTAYELNLSLLKAEQDKKDAAERRALKFKDAQDDLTIAMDGAKALQGLSDTVFAIQEANKKEGSKSAEKDARNQFKVNKALSMSTAAMQGAQSILAITAVPDFTLGVASALRIAGVVATTGAVIARIAGTQFQASASSGGGASAGASSATPKVPENSQVPADTTLFGTAGAFNNKGGGSSNSQGGGSDSTVVRAYVVGGNVTNQQQEESAFKQAFTLSVGQ